MDKILQIASKVRISYGLFYFRSTLDPLEITLNHSSLGIEERVGQGTLHTYGLTSNIGYEISDEWIINYDEIASFSSRAFNRKALGLNWERNLRPSKRPLYFNTGFRIGYARQGVKVNEYHTDQSFSLGRKEFNSDLTGAYLESRVFYFSPSISLSIEKSNRLRFYADLSYSFPLNERTGLYIYESKKSFFGGKSRFVSENNSDLSIQHPSGPVFKNSLMPSFGIMKKF